tara:strand:+ start:304 stop:663 length:360 start_codon:yes stop_codon:yes gene_type:complete
MWYITIMKIEITSPSPQVADAVRQHLGRSTHTYELWFLGDMVGEPLPKNRESLDALLKEAHQMLTDALPIMIGGCNGAEIVHRSELLVGGIPALQNDETVWSMSLDEFKKGHRLPIKTL